MSKNAKKSNKVRNAVIAAVIIVALVILLVVGLFGENTAMISSSEYFGNISEGEAALMINGEISEEKAVVSGGGYYIPFDALEDGITTGMYYDSQSGALCLTTEAGQRSWQDADGTGCVSIQDGKCYVSAECIMENTDINVQVFEEPSRIIVTSEDAAGDHAVMKSDANVHYRADKRSKLVAKVNKGDSVIAAEEAGEWCRVCTADGYGGYVLKDRLEYDAEDLPGRERSRAFTARSFGSTVKMVWFYSDNYETNDLLEEMMAPVRDVNIICPTWYALSSPSGDIYDCGQGEFVERAHNMGLAVWVMVSDYTGEGATTGEILRSADARSNLITQMVSRTKMYGADGINVDFEVIREADVKAYLQFLRELTLEAHNNGLIISVDNYVPEYTRYYDRAEQAGIVDYLVVMAYDEHTSSSEEAGSVASLTFVRKGIEDTIEEVPPGQVILAVPFYTRSWINRGGVMGLETEAMSMEAGENFASEHGIELVWDEEAGQYTGSASEGSDVYSIWLEDKTSLEAKLELVSEYSLAGASGWRLGKEKSDIWDVWDGCLE